MASRACGPRARNSPRRPAPGPLVWPLSRGGARPPPRAPPPPAALTACGIEESRALRAERRRAVGEGREASPGKASERGGAGGGVSKGLEPVLRKTGPRTKRNPRCELVDQRRLVPLPRRRCHLRTPPRVVARRAAVGPRVG